MACTTTPCSMRSLSAYQPEVSTAASQIAAMKRHTATNHQKRTWGSIHPAHLAARVNGRGGPGGAPGCWQPITRDLWPAPYLVMDSGASIAPYNHFELGQPLATEYVWGRQYGENTINP